MFLRQNFEILGDGQGIHWPAVNEDISVTGMLSGSPDRRPNKSAKQAVFEIIGIEPEAERKKQLINPGSRLRARRLASCLGYGGKT